jgi:hypothetical protein
MRTPSQPSCRLATNPRNLDCLKFVIGFYAKKLIQFAKHSGFSVYLVSLNRSKLAPMKLNSKLTLLGSITSLLVSPALHADDGAAACSVVDLAEVPELIYCEPDVQIVECFDNFVDCPVSEDFPIRVDLGEWVETGDVDGADLIEPDLVEPDLVEPELVDCELGGQEETTEPEVVICEKGDFLEEGELAVDVEEGGIPLDWLKRGHLENPEVMFQNTAILDGAVPTAFQAASTGAPARELRQDEHASAIEIKAASAQAPIKIEKKETIALVKAGRVFLR